MPVEDIIGYDRELFTVHAPAARGLCHFRLGQFSEAAAAYGGAERHAADPTRFRLMRQLSEHRGRCGDDAATPTARDPGRTVWHRRELLGGIWWTWPGCSLGLRATDAARASAMHALLGRMPRGDQPPAAELRFDGHAQPVPSTPSDEAQADVQIWYRSEGVFVSTRQGLSGRSWEHRARVGGYARDLSRAFGNVAPSLIAGLLAPHDRFLLHAGALQREGEALLLLGGSGAGKSTLVLGALNAGWEALSDDLILLAPAPRRRAGQRGAPLAGGSQRGALGARADHLPDERRPPPARCKCPSTDWDRGDLSGRRASILVDHGSAGRPRPSRTVERPEVLGNLLRAML